MTRSNFAFYSKALYDKHGFRNENRPFYSCVLSALAFVIEARLAVTLFCYKLSSFSYVNDHVHRLGSLSIPRFAHEKQEGL